MALWPKEERKIRNVKRVVHVIKVLRACFSIKEIFLKKAIAFKECTSKPANLVGHSLFANGLESLMSAPTELSPVPLFL